MHGGCPVIECTDPEFREEWQQAFIWRQTLGLCILLSEYRMMHLLWQHPEIQIKLLCGSAILILGTCLEDESTCPHKGLYMDAYHSKNKMQQIQNAIYFNTYFMGTGALPAYICVPCMCLVLAKVRREYLILWTQICRWLWATMWAFGIKPRCS